MTQDGLTQSLTDLVDIRLHSKELLDWLCFNGTFPGTIDLLHMMMFPVKNSLHKPSLDFLCRAPQEIQLPSRINKFLKLDKFPIEYSPAELFDSLICLAVATVSCVLFCIILHATLNRFYKRFHDINPTHKKWYVVANLMKGIMLAIICLNTKFVLGSYRLMVDTSIPVLAVKRTTVLYIVTDFVGLLIVPKLPHTTKMHHIFTFFIGIFIWSTNLQLPGWQGATGVAKLAVMYGMFSSLPYMVNIFLGLRVFVPKNRLTVLVSFISLITYLICCSLNWSIHLYWLILCIINLDITVWGVLYTFLLFYIIQDDIILIKFLVKYSLTDYDPKRKRD